MNFQEQSGDYHHDPMHDIEDGLRHTNVQWSEDEGDGTRSIVAPEAWAVSDGDQNLLNPPRMQ